MSKSRGLQDFIENRAAMPVFLIVAGCIICRSSSFWSGGALNIAALLGPFGLRVFDGATGLGISVGSELLSSIFGRQALRNKAEAFEAAGRTGIRKDEKAALVAEFTWRYKLSLFFMGLGLLASASAGFAFLVSTTQSHSLGSDVAELVITLTLVAILAALGIFYQPADHSSEMAAEHAQSLRARILEAAAGRITRGAHTPQDVRLLAGSLGKAEREKFLAALAPQASADDPLWTTSDLTLWLGIADDPSMKRQVLRRLAKLAEAGLITKNERGQYTLPRSLAAIEFSSDFVNMRRGPNSQGRISSVPSHEYVRGRRGEAHQADTGTTGSRQYSPPDAQELVPDNDTDATVPRARQELTA